MENCLVTKLKSVVQNENLVKIDDLVIDVFSVPYAVPLRQRFLWTGSGKNVGGYFTDSTLSESSDYTEFTSDGSDYIYVNPNYDCKIVLHSRKDATNLTMLWGGDKDTPIRCKADLLQVSDMTELITLHLCSCDLKNGDIANIKSNKLQTLGLLGSSAYGDASKLSPVLISLSMNAASWKTTRPSSSSLFTIGNSESPCDFGNDLDAYLSNIVNCTLVRQIVNIYVNGTETANTASFAEALKTKLKASSQNNKLVINGVEV